MSTLLYDNKTWSRNNRNGRKIQAMDLKLFINVKGCNKLDKINNEGIRGVK
jgi:hypothetical protein